MRRARPGAPPRGTGGRTLTSVSAGAGFDENGSADLREKRTTGPEPAVAGQERTQSKLWHITLCVSGAEIPLKEVRRGLEQLAHDHPFLLTSRYANDHAEIRYWEEARDLHDAAAVALRLWGSTAPAPVCRPGRSSAWRSSTARRTTSASPRGTGRPRPPRSACTRTDPDAVPASLSRITGYVTDARSVRTTLRA